MSEITVFATQFGKDHWSLLAYLETCCVDLSGEVDKRRMRCNGEEHPMLNVNGFEWDPKHGTRTKGGVLPNHDDWHCLDDLIAAGYVDLVGTMTNPVVALTTRGATMAEQLRRHKMAGGHFHSFLDEAGEVKP